MLMTLLRWLSVLPAAVLGNFAAQMIVRPVMRIVVYGWGDGRESTLVYSLGLCLVYALSKSVAVVAGALVAPRFQVAIASGIAILAVLCSVTIHIVGQYFAGNQVGRANYTHFAAQSLGAIAGAVCIYWFKRHHIPTGAGPPS